MNGIEWLLDTNIVLGLLKGQAAAVALAEAQNLELARAAVSQVTRMELLGKGLLLVAHHFRIHPG